jgi:hypothetical protein
MNPPPKNNIPIGHADIAGSYAPVMVNPEWMRFFQVAIFQQLTQEIADLKARIAALEAP